MQPLIQAMRRQAGGAGSARRRQRAYQICFALDAGARGIIAPMVNNRAEAEAMVHAAHRDFPLGNRSNAARAECGQGGPRQVNSLATPA